MNEFSRWIGGRQRRIYANLYQGYIPILLELYHVKKVSYCDILYDIKDNWWLVDMLQGGQHTLPQARRFKEQAFIQVKSL